MSALATLLLLTVTCAPVARPRLNEVLYDAVGDDVGHEYVEIANTTDVPATLEGLRLEAGDGAATGRWTLRWTGHAGDTLAPHARFVIGGALVTPLPDRLVNLDLQNGPDAVRLVWPDGASEVLGWGDLTFDEYHCGAPALDVASGRALARIPEDAGDADNRTAFREADPSPGAANVRRRDAAIVPHMLALEPEQPAVGAEAVLALRVTNHGLSAWNEGEARVEIDGIGFPTTRELALPALAASETLQVRVPFTATTAGRGEVVARILLSGDESAIDDTDTLRARIGPGPLELREIQFHPAASEGEWVEVRNRDAFPLALESYRLGDRAGATGRIAAGEPLAPDSLAILAQDPTALLMAHPALDPARVRGVTPWAALNNADDADGVADQVVLADADGVLDERVRYSATGLASGITLERDGEVWRPSIDAGGTPLAPPRLAEPVPGGFRVEPRRLVSGHDLVRFAWELPWASSRVTLELYDLDGRRTRRLAGPLMSGTHGERPIALDVTQPGLYLAVLRAESDAGSLTRVTALRIEGAAR